MIGIFSTRLKTFFLNNEIFFLQNEKNFYAIKNIFLHNKKYFSRWKINFYTMKYIFSTKNEFFYNENLSLHVDHYFSTQWAKFFYAMKNIILHNDKLCSVIWKIHLWKMWNWCGTILNYKIVFYGIFLGECNFG